MKTISRGAAFTLILIFGHLSAFGQSSGNFQITQSVIAGGGRQATGGAFTVDGTIGQPLAGANSSGGAFSTRGGFWTAQFAPTAAGVSISGRVKTESGKGIRNVRLILTNAATGEVFYARSGISGVYCFENISVAQSYILTVSARRFVFNPNTRFIVLLDEINDVDFIGIEQF